ncbi:UMP-CMP kinase 2, mitochondrial isoform X2 [Heterocephalus glaber]|uniref:UMP-CMP kinase 2, mitochondrial n=1 Tax=Heterocephalus glaber TaxID=10181 RepID=A0AAX6S088_HETGA|nr:UMP-CMP kinase 2, mitochondrial isoform X2 [Heterocephalus glaber]
MPLGTRPHWPRLPRRLGGPGWRRSGTCAPAMASPRRFALELADYSLAHFALGEAEAAGARPDPRLCALLGPPGRSFALCVAAAAGGGCGARVQAARVHQQLQLQLRQGRPFQQCQLLRLLGYSPGDPAARPQHGFLLRDPGANPDTRSSLLDVLGACPEPARPQLGEFETDESGALRLWLWALRGGERQQVRCARVVPILEPPLHPVVPDLPGSVVFPDRDAARAVLEEEAQAVLNLVDQCPKQVQKGKFPVIVIEGLDATGKTTVTRSISKELGAVLLQSPPSCMGQWRKIFDEEPSIIRRAFYSLGNYIVASEIAEESTRSPVIVDRYWHSTATYAIATELSGGLQHLPPAHNSVYQWPQDLLRPDLVVLLTVSPEERMQRLQGRGLEMTREESELEANSIFRQKVETSYLRMENPACHVVDASPSREEVLQTVTHLIRTTCY